MPPAFTDGAICVQRLDDSLNSAIHTRYRSSRRSSSKHEPRGPPLEVVCLPPTHHPDRYRARTLPRKRARLPHDPTEERRGEHAARWGGRGAGGTGPARPGGSRLLPASSSRRPPPRRAQNRRLPPPGRFAGGTTTAASPRSSPHLPTVRRNAAPTRIPTDTCPT